MKYWFSSLALVWATTGFCAEPPVQNSKLNAILFYQLLLGELNVQAGEPGSGFAIILDVARKTKDEALFQRATELALQSRSGEAALQAARSWKSSLPESKEANRYILQILLALNRIDEAGRALKASIASLPIQEQSAAIGSIPRVFGRLQDKNLAAKVVEQALNTAIQNSETAATAWTTIGRMKRDAGEIQPAAEAARAGHAANQKAPEPIMLAMSLLNVVPNEVQPMITKYMAGDALPDLRLGYARTLIDLDQMQPALAQLNQLTQQHPSFAPGWLFLGLLQSDLSQVLLSEQSLKQYIRLADNAKDPDQSGGLSEAYLALSQMAQKQGRWTQADEWLARIPPNADPLKVASRRAALLAQQGRKSDGLKLLEQVKVNSPQDARLKALAISQWLREEKQINAALTIIEQALAKFPADTDLQSEMAMLCEKLGRFDQMESLLRGIMKVKPADPHAFNALGYSLADRKIRLDEARELILKAVQLAPRDPFIQDSLGWLEYRVGNSAEAIRILEAAFKARPDAEIAAHLGEVYWQSGQQAKAGTIWREGLMLKSDNETLLDTLKQFKFKP
ncbi:MAG: tetratricopeptide repeat protein [Limnohabitans sp.]|nr:tetratricopeptide repeat protein [Limnohabitans sp.]